MFKVSRTVKQQIFQNFVLIFLDKSNLSMFVEGTNTKLVLKIFIHKD